MAVNGSFYGRERFDPLLILAQIVILQTCFYASFLFLLVLFNRATGTSASVTDQIFNHTYVTLRHFPGWVTCSALLLAAIGPTALAFVAVVGRAKRCVDFATTLLVSHIIATTIHSGFPSTLMWWLLNLVATAGLATVGETLSMRVELREISLRSDATGRDGADAPNARRGLFERKEQGRQGDIEVGIRADDVVPASAQSETENKTLVQPS